MEGERIWEKIDLRKFAKKMELIKGFAGIVDFFLYVI